MDDKENSYLCIFSGVCIVSGHICYLLLTCVSKTCRDNLAVYARDHQVNFILGYCSIYIFMQTFMIPGTIFMSLLAGALFGVIKGGILVVFTATAGASSCYFVSKLIGRPLVYWLWPEKLRYFQSEVTFLRSCSIWSFIQFHASVIYFL